MTLATAAAVAVASGVPLSVPLNDTNNIPNQSDSTVSDHLFVIVGKFIVFFSSQAVTSPLLDEVVQARRATICEEDITPKDLANSPDVENVQNINETTYVDEEKELVMAFNLFTLKYKEKRLEEDFAAHIGPHSLLIVEVLLALVSLLFIYLYFPFRIRTSILLGILIGLKLVFTLISLRFHQTLVRWWYARHLIASFYLLSPLLIILFEYPEYYPISLPVFILYISTYLTLGASISHLMKLLIAILSISIYLPLIIFSKTISSLSFDFNIIVRYSSFSSSHRSRRYLCLHSYISNRFIRHCTSS